MKKYSIDRIEGDFAVCEDDGQNQRLIPLTELPEIREGDILAEENGKFTVCEGEAAARRKKLAEMQRNLFGKK